MHIKGLIWLGTRTSQFDAMLHLYHHVMGLEITHQEPGSVVMDLPNGDCIELFGDESSYNTFFTHPVAGMLVDDIASARAEMEVQGPNSSVRSRRRRMAMRGHISVRRMDLSTNSLTHSNIH